MCTLDENSMYAIDIYSAFYLHKVPKITAKK